MKIELTELQVENVVNDYCRDLDEPTQQKLALMVFARHDRIDPFPALRMVLRQIEREHCLTRNFTLEALKCK